MKQKISQKRDLGIWISFYWKQNSMGVPIGFKYGLKPPRLFFKPNLKGERNCRWIGGGGAEDYYCVLTTAPPIHVTDVYGNPVRCQSVSRRSRPRHVCDTYFSYKLDSQTGQIFFLALRPNYNFGFLTYGFSQSAQTRMFLPISEGLFFFGPTVSGRPSKNVLCHQITLQYRQRNLDAFSVLSCRNFEP